MEQKIEIPSDQGVVSGLLSAQASNAVVIMLHGFNSHKNNNPFKKIETIFKEKKYDVLKIDAYGHGESAGKFEDLTITKAISSLNSVIDYLHKKGYEKIGLFGSSFGGLVSIFSAIQSAPEFIILKSPVSKNQGDLIAKMLDTTSSLWKSQGMAILKENNGEKKLNYAFYEDAQTYNALNIAHKIRCPLIVFHGEEDDVVPPGQSKELVSKVKNAQLVLIEETGHRYGEEAMKQMMDELSVFLDRISDRLL